MLSKAVLLISVLVPFAAFAQSTDATPAIATTTDSSASALDMPIEKIAQTSQGCAVLDKDFPGMREHPMYGSFKHMTLNQIAAMSHGEITPEMLVQAKTDLSALPSAPNTTTPVTLSASAEP
ncbi:MAG TPA: hypothetical protein VG889_11070 [Rhizomicrobium sp.]|nr:hypothetical protein [Rhizomicrobium sp.]